MRKREEYYTFAELAKESQAQVDEVHALGNRLRADLMRLTHMLPHAHHIREQLGNSYAAINDAVMAITYSAVAPLWQVRRVLDEEGPEDTDE